MAIYQYHGSVRFGTKGKLQTATSKNGLISLPEKTGKELGLKIHHQETIDDEFKSDKKPTAKKAEPNSTEPKSIEQDPQVPEVGESE